MTYLEFMFSLPSGAPLGISGHQLRTICSERSEFAQEFIRHLAADLEGKLVVNTVCHVVQRFFVEGGTMVSRFDWEFVEYPLLPVAEARQVKSAFADWMKRCDAGWSPEERSSANAAFELLSWID